MKLATTTGDFRTHAKDQLEALKYVAESGFRYVDYSFGIDYNTGTGIFSSDPDGFLEELKKKCEEYGVKYVQAHSPMGTPLADPDDKLLKATIACIEACGKLEIPYIVVHSGYLKDISKEETFKRNKEFFEKLFPAAEKAGVTILVENFDRMVFDDFYWIDNAPDLLEFVEFVNHPLLQVVWDTGHGNHQKLSQEDALTLLGKYVKALHVHDNDGSVDLHMCPYTGTLDFDSLMKGLKKIGYKGYFTFEACSFFAPTVRDTEMKIDLELRIEMEKLLYKLGEKMVESYSL